LRKFQGEIVLDEEYFDINNNHHGADRNNGQSKDMNGFNFTQGYVVDEYGYDGYDGYDNYDGLNYTNLKQPNDANHIPFEQISTKKNQFISQSSQNTLPHQNGLDYNNGNYQIKMNNIQNRLFDQNNFEQHDFNFVPQNFNRNFQNPQSAIDSNPSSDFPPFNHSIHPFEYHTFSHLYNSRTGGISGLGGGVSGVNGKITVELNDKGGDGNNGVNSNGIYPFTSNQTNPIQQLPQSSQPTQYDMGFNNQALSSFHSSYLSGLGGSLGGDLGANLNQNLTPNLNFPNNQNPSNSDITPPNTMYTDLPNINPFPHPLNHPYGFNHVNSDNIRNTNNSPPSQQIVQNIQNEKFTPKEEDPHSKPFINFDTFHPSQLHFSYQLERGEIAPPTPTQPLSSQSFPVHYTLQPVTTPHLNTYLINPNQIATQPHLSHISPSLSQTHSQIVQPSVFPPQQQLQRPATGVHTQMDINMYRRVNNTQDNLQNSIIWGHQTPIQPDIQQQNVQQSFTQNFQPNFGPTIANFQQTAPNVQQHAPTLMTQSIGVVVPSNISSIGSFNGLNLQPPQQMSEQFGTTSQSPIGLSQQYPQQQREPQQAQIRPQEQLMTTQQTNEQLPQQEQLFFSNW